MEYLLQWAGAWPVLSFQICRSFGLFAVLSSPCPGSEPSSYLHPPSPESLGTKASHSAFPPPSSCIQGYRGELGNRTWPSDRGCPACPLTELALIPLCPWKDRLFCDWTMSVLSGASTVSSPEHYPSLIVWVLGGAEERGKWRPCLGKQIKTLMKSKRRREGGCVYAE